MTKQQLPAVSDAQHAQDKAQARRRFLRTGSTGVILTLASGSGMATVCTVPSMTLSGPTMASRGIVIEKCAGGESPGYWKKEEHEWPAGITRGTLFGDVFSSDAPYATTTLGVMIKQQDPANYFDTHNLGCHFTAAYLNIHAGLVKFLTVDDLKAIWNELRTYGVYIPAPGADGWDKARVAQYLDSTYHD